MNEPCLFISAGDPSGDNAASRLVKSLNSSHPGIKLFGLGGPRLKELGQDQLAPGSKLAVLGFWEVAKHYKFFRSLFYKSLDEIKKRKPKAVLLVDYPGFNLRLAKEVKKLGIPVIYYISPQVWAWHKKRVNQIKARVDRLLVILPFEQKFFDKHDINAEFVGHYLLEDIPKEFIASKPPLPSSDEKMTLALLPGSRPQEVQRMLPVLAKTGQMMADKYGLRVVVAGLSSVKETVPYDEIIKENSSGAVEVRFDQTRELIHQSSMVVTASGTATLEVGIIGRPMVIIYKTVELTYQIAKRLIDLPMIGLVNLVLDKVVAPELIQHDATAEKICKELEQFWENEDMFDQMVQHLNLVPPMLGGVGASERAAKIVGEYF